jgi:hypothetical protein
LVVDFRRLNEFTTGDSSPLPLITEILDTLGEARYFTMSGCASALSTSTGHHEFCRLPVGLKSAPTIFQRLTNSITVGINGIKTLVYMEDLTVIGASLEEHSMALIEVFDGLRTYRRKIHPGKCEFLGTEICYLGHTVTAGVKQDKQAQAVLEFPAPKSIKQVKAFLGLGVITEGLYRVLAQSLNH